MRVHHVGVAVASIDEVLDDYVALGYTLGSRVLDEGRKVDIAFVRNGDYVVELVAPASSGSPVDGLLKKVGPSPYHLCYVVEDIAAAVRELRSAGYVKVTAPSPAPAIGYAAVAFLHHRRVGLVELVELQDPSDGVVA
jgi:methylmalonyl-CoA/ethylmalonyl-CoA epimerase